MDYHQYYQQVKLPGGMHAMDKSTRLSTDWAISYKFKDSHRYPMVTISTSTSQGISLVKKDLEELANIVKGRLKGLELEKASK